MDPQLEAQILAASHPLRLPGYGERRVLSPVAVERLAGEEQPRWHIEALALDLEVVPLHYLRNLAEYSIAGQARLLRSSVAVVGSGPVAERVLELLALNGVGRFVIRAPIVAPDQVEPAAWEATRLADMARNRNASSGVEAGTLQLRGGNPAEAARGVDVMAACLKAAADEQLLQFACKIGRVPLVIGAAEGDRGQATTVLPGDAGVALVYKPAHPHLEPDRTEAPSAKAALIAATWIAEQVTRLLLGSSDLLRGRLRYADLSTGELTEHDLR